MQLLDYEKHLFGKTSFQSVEEFRDLQLQLSPEAALTKEPALIESQPQEQSTGVDDNAQEATSTAETDTKDEPNGEVKTAEPLNESEILESDKKRKKKKKQSEEVEGTEEGQSVDSQDEDATIRRTVSEETQQKSKEKVKKKRSESVSSNNTDGEVSNERRSEKDDLVAGTKLKKKKKGRPSTLQ